jgi:hypothetical protein
MKNLREGEVRFIARQIDKLWRVYDRARGSYPYAHPDLGGTVVQDVDKSSAEAEAERLNGLFVKKPKPKLEQKKGASKGASKIETETEAEVVEEEVDIPELPDYGVLSEEEAARYEEGLIERVTY